MTTDQKCTSIIPMYLSTNLKSWEKLGQYATHAIITRFWLQTPLTIHKNSILLENKRLAYNGAGTRANGIQKFKVVLLKRFFWVISPFWIYISRKILYLIWWSWFEIWTKKVKMYFWFLSGQSCMFRRISVSERFWSHLKSFFNRDSFLF